MTISLYDNCREKRVRSRINGNTLQVNFGNLQVLDHTETVNLNSLMKKSPKTLSVRIDMSHVLMLPSGFFGALLDNVEAGRRVFLVNATPRIQSLIGYQKFVTNGEVHL